MLPIYTLGYASRSREENIALLQQYNVGCVLDIRHRPHSGHNPQFYQYALRPALFAVGIQYYHCQKLAGLRKPLKDSLNLGWRSSVFRGFADYMQTSLFTEGIDELIELSQQLVTCLLCAHALSWRCHRSLIADALLVRGMLVYDIVDKNTLTAQKLTSFAQVENVSVTYPYDGSDKESDEKEPNGQV